MSNMLDLLSGGTMQALVTQKIIYFSGGDNRRKISARRYDSRNAEKREYFLFRESAISIICATVRSLLDDRIVS